MFSGGYDVSPEQYSILLDAWAAAGFVVADPVYPLTTPASDVAWTRATSSTTRAISRP